MIKIMRLTEKSTSFETIKEISIESDLIYIDGNRVYTGESFILVVNYDKGDDALFVIVVNGKIILDTHWHPLTLVGHIQKYAKKFNIDLAFLDQLKPD